MEFGSGTADQPPPPPQYREQQPPPQPLPQRQHPLLGYRKPGFGLGNDYIGQGVGGTNEYFRQGTGWPNEYFQISSHVREEIQRSLEKERIRDEIISAEIARRRVLEAEVRAEIRMERELGLRATGSDAFNRFLFPLGGGMALDLRGVTFQQEAKGLVERVAMYAEERLRMGTRFETPGVGMVPFQKRKVEPEAVVPCQLEAVVPFQQMNVEPEPFQQRSVESEPFQQRSVKPEAKGFTPSHSENSEQKEKIHFVAKPPASLCGEKRKAVSPAEESRNTAAKEEWSCAICQVSTNSERVLKDHFQGKKHKSKEAALRAEIGVGGLPKTKHTVNPIIGDTHVLSSLPVEGEVLQINQSVLSSPQGVRFGGEAPQINQSELSSLHTVSTKCLYANSMLILQPNEKKDKLKLVRVQNAPKSKPKEKESYTFWCDMCQVGTMCEIVMEDHRKGKKHLKLLKKARENGQAANLASRIVDIQGANGSDEIPKEGDSKTFGNVDGTSTKVENDYVNGN